MLFLGSTAVVFFGWSVIYRNGGRLASRAEYFSKITSLTSDIRSLSQEALYYWCEERKDEPAPIKHLKLTLFIAQIRSIQERMAFCGVDDREASQSLACLRKSITLDAERPNSISDSEKKDKVASIVESCNSLVSALERHHDKLTKVDRHGIGAQ